jgi:hypothetical protein
VITIFSSDFIVSLKSFQSGGLVLGLGSGLELGLGLRIETGLGLELGLQ